MNAGAHGRQMKDVVRWAELVQADGTRRRVPVEELRFAYRHTRLPAGAVVTRQLERRDEPGGIRERVRAHLDYPAAHRAELWLGVREPGGGSAGRLIEEAGLKGRRVGGAAISNKHANFIVNLGGARAADVTALVREARDAVRARTGIELTPEVKPFGDSPADGPVSGARNGRDRERWHG